MPQNQTTVTVDVVEESSLKSVSGTATKDVNTQSSKSLELWVDVTAEASGDFDFILETSIDGTTFVVQQTIANVTAVGAQAISIARTDDPLGTVARARWIRNAGTATFSIRLVRRE